MQWFQRDWVFGLVLGATSLACATGTGSTLNTTRARIAELETENEALRDRLEYVECQLNLLREHVPLCVCPSYPAIDAFVLEVNRPLKLVVLDKGKRNSVKVGYVFSVYKDSTYKGQIRIQDVQEDASSGLILSEKNPIVSGDSASTVL